MRPSRMVTRRGASAARPGSCVTKITVVPAALRSASSRNISRAVSLSRFPVGSSPMRIRGRHAMALARATRCCSPPDSSTGRRSAAAGSIRRQDSRARACASRVRRDPCLASSIGSSVLSSADKVGMSWKNWNTMPMFARRQMASSSCPRQIEPGAVHRHRPGRRAVDARDEVDDGRLAAARRARRSRPSLPLGSQGRCRARRGMRPAPSDTSSRPLPGRRAVPGSWRPITRAPS